MRASRFTAVVLAALTVALAACSSGSRPSLASGSSSSSSGGAATSASSSAAATSTTAQPPADESAASAEITAAFTTFFDGTNNDQDAKAALLEDYETLKDAFAQSQQTNAALLSRASARVESVTFTGPASANVVFSILLDGNPALANHAGTSVNVDGKWLVSKATFCDVGFLTSPKPPECA